MYKTGSILMKTKKMGIYRMLIPPEIRLIRNKDTGYPVSPDTGYPARFSALNIEF
jgi:hypothetical protein